MTSLLLLVPLLAAAPAAAPPPTCDWCGMFIEAPRFAARMRTFDQRTLRFDAVECLAAFTIRPRDGALAAVEVKVARWDQAQREIEARRAVYLLSPALPSPMGLDLAAFADSAGALRARGRRPGRLLRWDQVVAYVRERWFQPTR